ncbi:MAG TPA: PKD domain-containing protein [Flavisolibacter sp.]|nr:PKD domain-containing protein [Flavisolibacter sp.]
MNRFSVNLAMLTIALCTLVVSCSKKGSDPDAPTGETTTTPAVADFTFSGTGIVTASMTFTNTSMHATSYNWDFGDNNTSTAVSPTHTYAKAGTYVVKLTAKGPAATSITTKTVTIQKPTSVKITGLSVEALPLLTPAGEAWDAVTPPDSGADVYYAFYNSSGVLLIKGQRYYDDVSSATLPLTYTLTAPIVINDFNAEQTVKLFDFDFSNDPDDLVSTANFNFSTAETKGYPNNFEIGSGDVKIKLAVQWQ